MSKWNRKDFIQAWKRHSLKKNWGEFSKAMASESGCPDENIYLAKNGLRIHSQIRGIKKPLSADIIKKLPAHPVRQTKASQQTSVEDDLKALGII